MTRDQALALRPGARLRLSTDAPAYFRHRPLPAAATLVSLRIEPCGVKLAVRLDGTDGPEAWHPDWWELETPPAPAWQPCPDCAATGREAADPDAACADCGGNGGHYARPAGVAV